MVVNFCVFCPPPPYNLKGVGNQVYLEAKLLQGGLYRTISNSCRAMSRFQDYIHNHFQTTLGQHKRYFWSALRLLQEHFKTDSVLLEDYFETT